MEEGPDIGAAVQGSLSIGVIGLVPWREIFSCREDVESRFRLKIGSAADMFASMLQAMKWRERGAWVVGRGSWVVLSQYYCVIMLRTLRSCQAWQMQG